jgi:hypothetical protein
VLLDDVLVVVLGAVVLDMAWPCPCRRGRHGYVFELLLPRTRYSSLSLTPHHHLPLDAMASLSLV